MEFTQFRLPGHGAGWMDLEKQTEGIFQHNRLSTPRESNANKAFFSQLLLLPTHFSHLERKVYERPKKHPFGPEVPQLVSPALTPELHPRKLMRLAAATYSRAVWIPTVLPGIQTSAWLQAA